MTQANGPGLEPDSVIPLFPLNTVVFPGGLLALRIFEQRYLAMVSRCLREGAGFGAAVIAEGREVGAAARPAPVGTYVSICDFDRGEDGLLHILAKGEQKIRITRTEVQPDQLLLGTVSPLPLEAPMSLPARHAGAASLLREILGAAGEPWSSLAIDYEDARDVGCRLAELLPLPVAARLELLAGSDPLARLEAVAAVIERAGLRPGERDGD